MKIFVSTGEVSGDLHLSYLVKEAKKIDNSVEFVGVAGKNSEKVGVEIIQNIDELAIMGFTQAIKKYRFLREKAFEYIEYIKSEKIKKVVLVDYGGFNLKFLELLKKKVKNIEVYFYIPPKLWIWGEKRIEKLKLADYIMVIFPWEVDFYKKHNVEVVYYGNPFAERYKKTGRSNEKILLLPGSRKQEIKSLIPEFLKLIDRDKKNKYILKLVSQDSMKWIDENLDKYENLEINWNITLEEAVKLSKLAIAASGTVTLELALLGIPTIVVYKTNIINYLIAKYILKVGYVSLPNLTLNKEVFPELLQNRCNVDNIEQTMNLIIQNEDFIQKEIDKVIERLSGDKIIENYAKFLLKGKSNE